ncbi:hypothetical protein [Chryseobacterium sp. SN22]|nr:hypothetical protein [Chryseobacterium sp. SN22]
MNRLEDGRWMPEVFSVKVTTSQLSIRNIFQLLRNGLEEGGWKLEVFFS